MPTIKIKARKLAIRTAYLLEFAKPNDMLMAMNFLSKKLSAKNRLYLFDDKYKLLVFLPNCDHVTPIQLSEFGFCRRPLKIDVAQLNEYGKVISEDVFKENF